LGRTRVNTIARYTISTTISVRFFILRSLS
jgi:hypothetical protein